MWDQTNSLDINKTNKDWTDRVKEIQLRRDKVDRIKLMEIKVPLRRMSFKYQLSRLWEHEQKSSRMYSTDSFKSYGLKQIHGGPMSMIHVGNKESSPWFKFLKDSVKAKNWQEIFWVYSRRIGFHGYSRCHFLSFYVVFCFLLNDSRRPALLSYFSVFFLGK
jgi:hypothetical protein